MNLPTRNDIIKIWVTLEAETLDSFCCPNCNTVLIVIENKHVCSNMLCLVSEIETDDATHDIPPEHRGKGFLIKGKTEDE